MMFWRPVGIPAFLEAKEGYRKVLGTGHFVMWCRCDLCGLSGPSHRFAWGWRGDTDGFTECCDNCMGDERIVGRLLEIGWSFE